MVAEMAGSEVGTKRVMVVEDTPDTRNLMAKFLTYQGHVVQTAIDGQDGLDVIETFHPDVILLDLQMPRLDGLGFLQRIRQDPRWQAVRVIIFTGYDLMISAKQLADLAVEAVMIKGSMDLRKLAALVRG